MSKSRAIIDRQIEVRRLAVERDFINGRTGCQDLAARHGVSPATITFDLKAIYQRWQQEGKELEQADRMHALKMFGEVFRLSMDGYRRSQKNKEKIRTEYKEKTCEACKGTGWKGGSEDSGEWCSECQGDGKLMVEEITREVLDTGQAGDPSFLRVANDSVREGARLRGLYPDRPKYKEGPPLLNVENLNIDLANVEVDAETILRVKLAMARAQGAIVDVVVEKGE